MIKVVVLGAAAGGGVPQWNCNCANCRAARTTDPDMASTQASLAVSADGEKFVLINASPDLRQQIGATPALHPRGPSLRHSPIEAVVLTNGEVDAVAGLLSLREGTPFTVFAHRRVLDVLAENPIFDVLRPGVVDRREIAMDQPFEAAGLTIESFAVPGKAALYREDSVANETGDTIGLRITTADGGGPVYVLTACAEIGDDLRAMLEGAPLVFFDGTLWTDDEMVRLGLSQKTGGRMGHLSMTETMPALDGLGIGRKVFLHINNSNPALRRGSAERTAAERAGWQIAGDGMEITL